MKQRAKRHDWPLPNFTNIEFVEQFINDPIYLKLHADWVLRNYNKWWSPSVDRIDADLPYQRGNIQWKRWGENWAKSQVIDHRRYDCYQITMGGAMPELPKVNGNSKDFNIRPEYSFDFGAFILSKRQRETVMIWDTEESAKQGAKDFGVPESLVTLAAYWENRAVSYTYGLCHPALGFMSIPF